MTKTRWGNATRALSIAIASLLFAVTARSEEPQTAVTLAPIWTIHVDVVPAASSKQFEELCTKQAAMSGAILKENGVETAPAWVLASSAGGYLTFRPHQTFAELDTPSKLSADVQKLIDKTVGPLDDEIHATLTSHYDQIWLLDREASWIPGPLPARMSQPGYVRIRTSRVRPDKAREYGEALVKFRNVLAQARYPVGLLTFFAQYGEGTYIFVLYANSRIISDTATPLIDVMDKVLGEEAARKLNSTISTSATRVLDNEAKPHPEMSISNPAVGWFGIPLAK